MSIDLDRIETLARVATPGPWTLDAYDGTYLTSPTGHLFWDGEGLGLTWPNDADATYIAALSPDVVLALVADARRGAALTEAVRLLGAARSCIASDFGPETERHPWEPMLRLELLGQLNTALESSDAS